MNIQEAKDFFMEYNGLEFHMFHDSTSKYAEYKALHLPQATLELWRQELIEEHFEKLEDPKCQETYGLIVGRLIEVLHAVSSPVEDHIRRLLQCLSSADALDEIQKIRILEHMAGHSRDRKDSGIYLVRTTSNLEEELKECLSRLSDFSPSPEYLSRYLKAVNAVERLLGEG